MGFGCIQRYIYLVGILEVFSRISSGVLWVSSEICPCITCSLVSYHTRLHLVMQSTGLCNFRVRASSPKWW